MAEYGLPMKSLETSSSSVTARIVARGPAAAPSAVAETTTRRTGPADRSEAVDGELDHGESGEVGPG